MTNRQTEAVRRIVSPKAINIVQQLISDTGAVSVEILTEANPDAQNDQPSRRVIWNQRRFGWSVMAGNDYQVEMPKK